MELVELCEVELTYVELEALDFDAGGQLYGTLEGSLTGEQVSGRLRLTNLAARRADGVNLPTLRGAPTASTPRCDDVLTTDDAEVWVELDGIATLRPEDEARIFVTTFRFRTGDPRYTWLNTTFGVLEGVGSTPSVPVDGREDVSTRAVPP